MANHLPIEKRRQIFHLLCEGNGIRTINRLMGCSVNTITELRKRFTYIAEFLNKKYICCLSVKDIHADEIKTYVNNADNPKWVFISMDTKSRLVINFYIGDRSGGSAKIFLSELSNKLTSKANVITDLLVSYIASVKKTPYGRIEAAIKNINLLSSNPEAELRRMNNRIESQNGTVRQHVSPLARKTLKYAKCDEGLRQNLILYFFYYNFMKKHTTLKTSPAVSAGLITKPLTFDALLEYDLIFTSTFTHKDSENFGRVKTYAPIRNISDYEMNEFVAGMAGIDGIKKGTNREAYGKKAKVVPL